ncbi:hypothetical protein BVX99_02845, partial [bacterium F16]
MPDTDLFEFNRTHSMESTKHIIHTRTTEPPSPSTLVQKTLLSGDWSISMDDITYKPVNVPGSPYLQGVKVDFDTPFWYQKEIPLPDVLEGQKVVLQFDGVYSEAWVSINGSDAGHHLGGFTSWEVELSPDMLDSDVLNINVKVIDRSDDVSAASLYARHRIGGILRDVWLVIRPPYSIVSLRATPDLDPNYEHGVLTMDLSVSMEHAIFATHDVTLQTSLLSPDGDPLEDAERTFSVLSRASRFECQIPNIQKWTDETPSLYQLKTRLLVNQEVQHERCDFIGFRNVETQGNTLLLNGKAIRLRGINRHDIHPERGRCSSREIDEKDVALIREANLNFVRTAHYPPSNYFLELCDRHGLLVECETAACFNSFAAGRNLKTQHDENYVNWYLQQ